MAETADILAHVDWGQLLGIDLIGRVFFRKADRPTSVRVMLALVMAALAPTVAWLLGANAALDAACVPLGYFTGHVVASVVYRNRLPG